MSFKANKNLGEHEQQTALLHLSANIANRTKLLALHEKQQKSNKFCKNIHEPASFVSQFWKTILHIPLAHYNFINAVRLYL